VLHFDDDLVAVQYLVGPQQRTYAKYRHSVFNVRSGVEEVGGKLVETTTLHPLLTATRRDTTRRDTGGGGSDFPLRIYSEFKKSASYSFSKFVSGISISCLDNESVVSKRDNSLFLWRNEAGTLEGGALLARTLLWLARTQEKRRAGQHAVPV
jgi:hypothetical protein